MGQCTLPNAAGAKVWKVTRISQAKHLVRKMLAFDESKGPTMEAVLGDPFFSVRAVGFSVRCFLVVLMLVAPWLRVSDHHTCHRGNEVKKRMDMSLLCVNPYRLLGPKSNLCCPGLILQEAKIATQTLRACLAPAY